MGPQLGPWVAFAYLLLVMPLLVVRFAVRDRESFRLCWFVVLVAFATWGFFGILFVRRLLDFLNEFDLVSDREAGAVLIASLVAGMGFWGVWRLVRKQLPSNSVAFRIFLSWVVVGLGALFIVWSLEDEFDVEDVIVFSWVVVPIFLGGELLLRMIRRKGKARRVKAARLLVLCYLISVVALGFLAKGFYLAEKYWVARNTLWKSTEDYPTKVWEVILPQLAKEQEEFLKDLPPVRLEMRQAP